MTKTPLRQLQKIAQMPWLNALWFQLCWWLAVLGQDPQLPWLTLLVLLYLGCLRPTLRQFKGITLLAFIGIALDSLLQFSGVLVFPAATTTANIGIPYWLMLLWFALALSLHYSMRWLLERPLLACLAGAIAGPASYMAGQQFAAVQFGLPLMATLPLLSLIWGILLGLICQRQFWR